MNFFITIFSDRYIYRSCFGVFNGVTNEVLKYFFEI